MKANTAVGDGLLCLESKQLFIARNFIFIESL